MQTPLRLPLTAVMAAAVLSGCYDPSGPIPEDRKKVEVLRRLADVTKAKETIGFQAQVDLKEGLKRLIQWLDQQKKPING